MKRLCVFGNLKKKGRRRHKQTKVVAFHFLNKRQTTQAVHIAREQPTSISIYKIINKNTFFLVFYQCESDGTRRPVGPRTPSCVTRDLTRTVLIGLNVAVHFGHQKTLVI